MPYLPPRSQADLNEEREYVEMYVRHREYNEALQEIQKYYFDFPKEKLINWIKKMIKDTCEDEWYAAMAIKWINHFDLEEEFYDDLPYLLGQALRFYYDGNTTSIQVLIEWVDKTRDPRLIKMLEEYVGNTWYWIKIRIPEERRMLRRSEVDKEKIKEVVEKLIEEEDYAGALKRVRKYYLDFPKEKLKEMTKKMIEKVRKDYHYAEDVIDWVSHFDLEGEFYDDLPFLLRQALEYYKEIEAYPSPLITDWMDKFVDDRLDAVWDEYGYEMW